MKTILSSQTMDIPDGVKVRVNAKMVEVSGPQGTLIRNFKHLNLDFQLIEVGSRLKVDAWFGSRRSMAAIRTALSHVQNLITGVTKGSSISNNSSNIEIRNFLGEKKLFRKRIRDYESDSEDDAEEAAPEKEALDSKPVDSSDDDEERDLDAMDEFGSSNEEIYRDEGGIGARNQGITKFTEGCRAFRVALKKIMKKHLPDDPLGPILSAHKKLVAEKLAEEVVEKKAKGEAKKEKDMAGEKGHVKSSSLLDAKEKQLISIATKGVVKLFNAVNKAQNSLKGLNPSRSKDAKDVKGACEAR